MATILIVDDLAANRELLTTLLRYQGHTLLEAANGAEALDAVASGRPDMVITDVLMPVMDGYELVKQLRLDPASRSIPVVFYTAHYGEREARTLALASGVSFVLTKPAEPDDVLAIVERVLGGASDPGVTPGASPLSTEFDREHLRLVTDKLSAKAEDLQAANARLRALINIGLELASERDSDRLLTNVCTSARELFGATYVTLGILDRHDATLRRLVTCGADVADWFPLGEPVSGLPSRVIADRQTMRGEHSGDSSALGLPAGHPPVQAFLAAPIASPAHVYGWVMLAGNDGRPFTEEDEHLLRALSGQVGRIYENGYFYAVAQKRAEALEREILERQRAESAVREERDRAQRYLDTVQVIVLALDVHGRITLVNEYGCSILGWTAEQLLGRDWIETCLPARIRDALRRTFDDLVAGDVSLVENPVLTRSGSERLIEWRNTVLKDDAGVVIGTLSSGTDITDRNRAEAALRTADERMRFALENADVGIWDMDYTTGVLQWSANLESQHGLQPGSFAGTFEAFVASVHPEDRQSLLDTISAAMKSGADFTTNYRALWPDGTVRWLTGAGRVHLGDDGRPVRGVGIALDVTGRHALEEQYQQAQKMEAVGRLAGGVAHDFNNLLNAILGYCELLLADVGPDDPRRADITEIQKAGTSAAGLTRQLLAFSRKQIIEPTLIDLNVVMADLRTMLERLIGEDVEVVLGLGSELAPVKADRGQVEQIVMNLAVNARDAMPSGGTLTIETDNVELDEEYARMHIGTQPGAYVALTVSDTGTGMTPEVQARLFEPFFTTKEPGRGTGLGLATVHGIVMRSGGSIGVYSEVGKGTSVKVYLPRADAAEFAAGPIVGAPASLSRTHSGAVTVLVVEDSKGLRELVRRLLERQGYTVLVAGNADEALGVFESTASIDVLLTDVVMPGASGPELTRQLIAQRPSLKVIYMSGYTEDAIVHHGVLTPGIAFLQKPFTSETLEQKIREVVDR